MGKSRIKNDPSYEGRISLAIDALKNAKIEEVRRAARLFDVSEATLRRRLKGNIPSAQAGALRQKLTPIEEESLQSWILSLERRVLPPRHQMLHEMAVILLRERDPTKVPKKTGHNWVQSFLKWHPDL
jgi:hypothetical protein